MNSLVLIGPRGSGKTVVGRELSLLLGLPFVDADVEFVQRHGSIADFVKANDWQEFRRLETEVIAGICSRYQGEKIVFAPGGGAVAHDQGIQYRDRNAELLRVFGIIFYLLPNRDLNQSAAILTERVQRDAASASSRPALTGNADVLKEMLAVLEKRHPLYHASSNHVIYSEGKSPGQLAQEINRISSDPLEFRHDFGTKGAPITRRDMYEDL